MSSATQLQTRRRRREAKGEVVHHPDRESNVAAALPQ